MTCGFVPTRIGKIMEYVFYYLIGCALLGLGYFIGVKDERKNGPAACQKIMDAEIAEYYAELNEWDELAKQVDAEIDFGPASKKIIHYGSK
jgi:hypothetical protein